jgi:hypothetical protein
MYSQNVVHILVAMMNPDTLNKHQDEKGFYVDTTVTLKLQGYDFRFRKQKASFQPNIKYSPFFWKRKEDDLEEEDPNDATRKPTNLGQHSVSSSQVSLMEVDGTRSTVAGGVSVGLPVLGAGVASTAGAASGRPNLMGRTRPVAAMELPLKGPPTRLFGISRPRAMERLELVGPPVVDATPTTRPSASLGATQQGVLAAMMGATSPCAGEDY